MPELDPNNLPNDVESLKALLLANHEAQQQSAAQLDEIKSENAELEAEYSVASHVTRSIDTEG